ncbi:MAG TPA: EAL domain-containing protein [Acidimicrobiales bacterium]|nr:EAL domain-containing protein [Acidimicrobiales bacterium]
MNRVDNAAVRSRDRRRPAPVRLGAARSATLMVLPVVVLAALAAGVRPPVGVAAGVALTAVALWVLHLVEGRIAAESTALAEAWRLNRRFATGFDNAPIGMAQIDIEGRISRVNPSMVSLLETSLGELGDRPWATLIHPDDRDRWETRVGSLIRGEVPFVEAGVRYLLPSGDVRSVRESISALDRSTDPDRNFLVQVVDLTAQTIAEEELRHQALHDSLTGLPNRVQALDHLRGRLREAEGSGRAVAVVFVDLDRTRAINEGFGHSHGDALIREAASRLLRAAGDQGLVARFGGDEFVVITDRITSRSALRSLSRGIHRVFSEPLVLDEGPIGLSVSIGVSVGLGGECTAESLMGDADTAVARAKREGRGRTEHFVPEIRLQAQLRAEMEQDLRLAVERREFEIHYQPVVDLATREVEGLEALIRWRHPRLGLLEPAAFLPVAEESGILDRMDLATLAGACAQMVAWSERIPAASRLHLSVNCSSRWFHEGRLGETLSEVLETTGMDPRRLWLEVTETELLNDSDATSAAFEEAHRLGVRVAIDDFGTGFSSLAYLSRFRVDRLKIDRSFVHSVRSSTSGAAIVTAVVDLAGALGVPTVAEGAEDEADLEILAELGADLVQGFALSRPRSGHEIEKALRAL